MTDLNGHNKYEILSDRIKKFENFANHNPFQPKYKLTFSN